MEANRPIFFVRHAKSESNSDPEKKVTLATHGWRIAATSEGLEKTNLTAITDYLRLNPDRKFAIISSPLDRTVATAERIKTLLGKSVLGIKTWGELVEFSHNCEVRIRSEEVDDIYGETKDADFYVKLVNGKLENSDKPIDGESLDFLLQRAKTTSEKILKIHSDNSLGQLGVNLENIAPIYVGHCWHFNAIFHTLGLLNVESWKDIGNITNAHAIRVDINDGLASSPNLKDVFTRHSQANSH